MIFRCFKRARFLVFAVMLPFIANSTTEGDISEKRKEVAMRMIGHEVLLCLGDAESRVMPIEKTDAYYKIPFEFEFGFDPSDIVSIIDRVMTETGTANHYLVQVEQCATKKIVHSFEMYSSIYADIIPCLGRVLPKDCYSLLITIWDGPIPAASRAKEVAVSSGTSLASSGAYLIIPLLILIGFIGYFVKKEKPANSDDPNSIAIGASQFDKRNMTLSFEGKSIELSNKEAELLALLHTSANAPVEREILLQRVWGDEGDYVGRTLDVFISKLRKKLKADTSVKIVNIRGIGYKLVTDVPG